MTLWQKFLMSFCEGFGIVLGMTICGTFFYVCWRMLS